MKFFNYDSPFWSFMSRIADLVIVNILWLVFCIPVFTIGASTAAMYRVTLNLVRGEGTVSSAASGRRSSSISSRAFCCS